MIQVRDLIHLLLVVQHLLPVLEVDLMLAPD
jgi:hypothetical protein